MPPPTLGYSSHILTSPPCSIQSFPDQTLRDVRSKARDVSILLCSDRMLMIFGSGNKHQEFVGWEMIREDVLTTFHSEMQKILKSL